MPYWVYRMAGQNAVPVRSFPQEYQAWEFVEHQENLWRTQGMNAPPYKVCCGSQECRRPKPVA